MVLLIHCLKRTRWVLKLIFKIEIMKKIFLIIFKSITVVTIAMFVLGSCEKNLQEEPYSFISKDNFYNNERDAESALLGVYASQTSEWLIGHWYTILLNLLDDQCTINRGSAHTEVDQFNILPNNSIVNSIWPLIYKTINCANVAINRIPNIEMDEDLKTTYVAEARCIRASMYFLLVRLWGSVPFSLDETTDISSANIVKGSIDEIYSSIIDDLDFADANLPESRPANEFGRVTRWTAKAYLADVYLTLGDWSMAADKANEIIESGMFSLEQNFEDVFKLENEQSKEIIYSYVFDKVYMHNNIASYSHDGGNNNAMCFSGVKVWSVDIHSDMWLNWSNSDPRKALSVGDKYLAKDGKYKPCTPNYPEFKKYNAPMETSTTQCPLNIIAYRYADILLMYAESSSQASGGPTLKSYEAFNMVRRRGYQKPIDQISVFDLTPGLNSSAFRDSVILERSHEFVSEMKRIFDLLRTNQYPQILKDMGKNINPAARYLPIPELEIDANSSLSSEDQNEGY